MTIKQRNALKTTVKQNAQTGHSEAGPPRCTAYRHPRVGSAVQRAWLQGKPGQRIPETGREVVWSGRHQGEPSAERTPESGRGLLGHLFQNCSFRHTYVLYTFSVNGRSSNDTLHPTLFHSSVDNML